MTRIAKTKKEGKTLLLKLKKRAKRYPPLEVEWDRKPNIYDGAFLRK